MRRHVCMRFVFVLALSLCVLLPLASAESKAALTVVTSRPEALYAIGEEVTFEVSLTRDGAAVDGPVSYELSNDGADSLGKGRNGGRDPYFRDDAEWPYPTTQNAGSVPTFARAGWNHRGV